MLVFYEFTVIVDVRQFHPENEKDVHGFSFKAQLQPTEHGTAGCSANNDSKY